MTDFDRPTRRYFELLEALGQAVITIDGLAHEDERFAYNPLVTGYPSIRFCSGAPPLTSDGFAVGTVCAIDHRPRNLTAGQREALRR